MTVLRQGLLDGRAVALAGAPPAAVGETLRELGARVVDLGGAQEWTDAGARLDAVVCDAGPAFAEGGQDRLREAVEQAWTAVRSVATGALIPAGAGKIVLIAPRSEGGSVAGAAERSEGGSDAGTADAGSFAAAARAGLENLARTLSVEWARHGVTAVAIAPGPATADEQLAELVCFLVSPAGEYFSGCVFALGG